MDHDLDKFSIILQTRFTYTFSYQVFMFIRYLGSVSYVISHFLTC